MIKKSIILLLLSASLTVGAHCPASFKPENVCLMLDQNIIFIYDQKGEHNGPYKDFAKSSIESIKSKGTPVKFSHTSRGVYKIDSTQALKSVDIEILNANKKIPLKLTAD